MEKMLRSVNNFKSKLLVDVVNFNFKVFFNKIFYVK